MKRTMDIILLVVCILAVVFTVTMIVTFWRFAAVPDTLVVSVYGAIFGECSAMALIRTAKEKYREREQEKGSAHEQDRDRR